MALSARSTISAAISAGAAAQPMREPVMAWDLDSEPMITVRSAMPGRARGDRCGWSQAMPS